MSHYLYVYTDKNISVVLVHRRLCRHLLGRRESEWPILFWSESVISLWEEGRGGTVALQWRNNGRDCVSNHQPHHCLLNRLFGRRSKKTAKLPSLAFIWGIHRWPVKSAHKWPVTRKMFPFDDVFLSIPGLVALILLWSYHQFTIS